MYKAKKFISYMALCVLIFSLCACGEKGSENAAIYGETVGGLEDNELFAIIDTNMTTDYEKYADYPHIGIDSIEKSGST